MIWLSVRVLDWHNNRINSDLRRNAAQSGYAERYTDLRYV